MKRVVAVVASQSGDPLALAMLEDVVDLVADMSLVRACLVVPDGADPAAGAVVWQGMPVLAVPDRSLGAVVAALAAAEAAEMAAASASRRSACAACSAPARIASASARACASSSSAARRCSSSVRVVTGAAVGPVVVALVAPVALVPPPRRERSAR